MRTSDNLSPSKQGNNPQANPQSYSSNISLCHSKNLSTVSLQFFPISSQYIHPKNVCQRGPQTNNKHFQTVKSVQFLKDQLKNRQKELSVIKDSINKRFQQYYCYPNNLKEIKKVLQEFTRKTQIIFYEKQIGIPNQDLSKSPMKHIRHLFSLIQESLHRAHIQLADKQAGVIPSIRKLYHQRQIEIHNNKKYIEYIEQLKAYSRKQKQKKNRLQIYVNELKKRTEEDTAIIYQIQEIAQKLQLKYSNRNQLLLMIKFVSTKIKDLQKNDEQINS